VKSLLTLACVLSLSLAGTSAANAAKLQFHPPLSERSLSGKAAGQRLIIRHDQQVLSWFKVHPQVSALNPEAAVPVIAFHRAQLKWTRRELKETQRALHPPRPAVDSCLSQLIWRESKGKVHATNPTTGAYGIPQALPGSKMASAGPDWRDNAATQIRWMIGYVNARWGGSCSALAHQVATGWY
jgi:hypothetical protein